MANVYLNTGALSLYSSANGTDWAQMSGSSPYTLAVNTYYKLTATPPSGQILAKWTLENNIDNIITLSNNYTPETIFNTLEQTWNYTEDKTIIITPTYVNEDNEYLNKRGLKDVVERLAKVEPIAQNNTKNKTFYTQHEWAEDAEDPILHQRLEALSANNWALLRNTRRNPEEQDLMSMIEAQGISINDSNALTSFFLRWLESANAEDLLTIFNGANPPEGRDTVFENPNDDVIMKWPNSNTDFSLNWLYKKGEWNYEHTVIFPYGYLAQVWLEEDTELSKFIVVVGECWQAPRADSVFLHHNDYDYHFALQTDLTKYLLTEDIDGYLPTETDVINSSTTYELPTASAVKNYVTSQGYVTTDTDTKNTAGATDSSSKLYLIGATSQSTNPQTYSDNEVFVKDGVLNAQELTIGSRKSGTTIGTNSIAEGIYTTASGESSHAEGNYTIASGEGSHAEGFYSQALGDYSHAEGIGQSSSPSQTTVTIRSHTIPSSDDNDESVINVLASWVFLGGYFKFNNHYFRITNFTRASNEMPYYNCTIKPGFTISEAQSIIDNTTTLEVIHFGQNLLALGECSHAEGAMNQAIGMLSHAEGQETIADGSISHTEGTGTIAKGNNQHVQGTFNIVDTTSAHIVGNGTGANARSNAATVAWNGEAWFQGDIYTGSTSGKNKDAGSKKLATEELLNTEIEKQYNVTENITNAINIVDNGATRVRYSSATLSDNKYVVYGEYGPEDTTWGQFGWYKIPAQKGETYTITSLAHGGNTDAKAWFLAEKEIYTPTASSDQRTFGTNDEPYHIIISESQAEYGDAQNETVTIPKDSYLFINTSLWYWENTGGSEDVQTPCNYSVTRTIPETNAIAQSISTIKVNGTAQYKENKTVNLTIPTISYGTTDLVAGTSALEDGTFYFVYE